MGLICGAFWRHLFLILRIRLDAYPALHMDWDAMIDNTAVPSRYWLLII